MALNSQGVVIRRESTVIGTTAYLSTNTISFDNVSKEIRRQAGFTDFVAGMRVFSNASLNNKVFTISSATAATTHLGVYDAVAAQASGVTVTLTGHVMQAIGEVVSFNGPGITANVIDVTTLQSTAKEKLVGLQDPGQVSLSVLFNVETSSEIHRALESDMVSRTKRWYDIIETHPTTHKGAMFFNGYVSGFSITGAVDQALKADISITLSSGCEFILPVSS